MPAGMRRSATTPAAIDIARRARRVLLIIKQRATEAGIDASQLSGHRLRAGFVTAVVNNGTHSTCIRAQTDTASDAMLQRYYRHVELYKDNPNRDIW